MTRTEIEEKVRNFLIEDLEIDVDIVVIVDKNFGFKIKPEEMQGVDTFSKFCDYIESKVNNG